MLSLPGRVDIGQSLNGAAIALAPMTAAEAAPLGEELALIDPWVRYGLASGSLARHLGSHEEGAPRYVLRMNAVSIGAMTLRLNWFGGPYLQFFGILSIAQGQGI